MKKILLFFITVLLCGGVFAQGYYDVLSQSMPSSGSFSQCIYYRYNPTTTISVTGFTKYASSAPARGFLYSGSLAPSSGGNCALANTSFVASCTFSGNNCMFDNATSYNPSENFTIAMDNSGSAWTEYYGSSGMPATGNTTILNWLGAGSNTAPPTYLDGSPRSITGVYFNSLAADSLTYASPSISNQRTSATAVFNITLASTGTLSLTNCTIAIDNGTGILVNRSVTTLSGTAAYCNYTSTNNATVGANIRYQWFFNGNNSTTSVGNATQIYSFIAYNVTPNGTANYTKYPNNYLPYDVTNSFPQWHALGGEMTSFIENGVMYYYMHRQNDSVGSTIFYGSTTDPYNITMMRRLSDFDNMDFQYLASTQNQTFLFNYSRNNTPTYHMFVTNNPGLTTVYHYTSVNKINWTRECTLTGISGTVANTAVYYDSSSGVWDMLLDYSPWGNVKFLNSTDGCTFALQGNVMNLQTPWMMKLGNQYVVYGSYAHAGGFAVEWFKGNRLDNLTLQQDNLLQTPSQPWESGDISDSNLVLVPRGQIFGNYSWYHYYMGDQNNTGVAYDADGRSFAEAHSVTVQWSNASGVIDNPPVNNWDKHNRSYDWNYTTTLVLSNNAPSGCSDPENDTMTVTTNSTLIVGHIGSYDLFSNFTQGEYGNYTIGVTCTDNNTNSATKSFVLTIEDYPPVVSSVNITRLNDLLNCTSFAFDPDGGTITKSILWFINGTSTGVTTSPLNVSSYANVGNATCQVTASDAVFNTSANSTAYSLNVVRQASTISIDPAKPVTVDDIIMTATCTSPYTIIGNVFEITDPTGIAINYSTTSNDNVSFELDFNAPTPGTYLLTNYCEDSSSTVFKSTTKAVIVKERVGVVLDIGTLLFLLWLLLFVCGLIFYKKFPLLLFSSGVMSVIFALYLMVNYHSNVIAWIAGIIFLGIGMSFAWRSAKGK